MSKKKALDASRAMSVSNAVEMCIRDSLYSHLIS